MPIKLTLRFSSLKERWL